MAVCVKGMVAAAGAPLLGVGHRSLCIGLDGGTSRRCATACLWPVARFVPVRTSSHTKHIRPSSCPFAAGPSCPHYIKRSACVCGGAAVARVAGVPMIMHHLRAIVGERRRAFGAHPSYISLCGLWLNGAVGAACLSCKRAKCSRPTGLL